VLVLFIILLLILIAIGMPIAITFVLVGFWGVATVIGFSPTVSILGSTMYYSINTTSYAALPLFILMGAFAARAGFAKKAYECLNMFTIKLPGALAVATSFACGIFGAICGSSLATTAIFGKIALPEMERFGYDKKLSLGTIASAGTFASMIPPSTGLIVYAMFTDQSIAKLFLAGIIPGIFTAIVYSISIIIRVKLNPDLAPMIKEVKYSAKEKFNAVKQTWSIVLLIAIVLGGIYSGLFTPTEAAAMGALAALVIGVIEGNFRNVSSVVQAVMESARTSSMVFLVVVGAMFFSRFVAIGQVTDNLMIYIQGLKVHRHVVMAGILVIWFLLGMIMTPTAIKALTLPVIFPLIVSLGYNPIWFGIVTQKLSEIAAVTPPVGLNVYTMKAVAGKETPIELVFAGIWPFVLCDVFVLILLMIFPILSVYLPNLLI